MSGKDLFPTIHWDDNGETYKWTNRVSNQTWIKGKEEIDGFPEKINFFFFFLKISKV